MPGIKRQRAVRVYFGLGSDAPIVLDDRQGPANPRVLRLRWSSAEGNRWVVMAPDFVSFVAGVDLGSVGLVSWA